MSAQRCEIKSVFNAHGSTCSIAQLAKCRIESAGTYFLTYKIHVQYEGYKAKVQRSSHANTDEK